MQNLIDAQTKKLADYERQVKQLGGQVKEMKGKTSKRLSVIKQSSQEC